MSSWSVVVERTDVSHALSVVPEYMESRYRRYEHTTYGLVPLTDEDWESGDFTEVAPFGGRLEPLEALRAAGRAFEYGRRAADAGCVAGRHYIRVVMGAAVTVVVSVSGQEVSNP